MKKKKNNGSVFDFASTVVTNMGGFTKSSYMTFWVHRKHRSHEKREMVDFFLVFSMHNYSPPPSFLSCQCHGCHYSQSHAPSSADVRDYSGRHLRTPMLLMCILCGPRTPSTPSTLSFLLLLQSFSLILLFQPEPCRRVVLIIYFQHKLFLIFAETSLM